MAHIVKKLGVVLTALFSISTSAALAEDGVKLFNAKRFPEARAAFEKALTKQSDPNTLYYYSLTLQQLGDTNAARASFKKIVEKYPSSGAAAYARQALGLPPQAASAGTSATPTSGTPTASNAKIPADFPVAAYPSATGIKVTNVKAGCIVSFDAPAAAATVLNFYKQEFATKGWTYEPPTSNDALEDGHGFRKGTARCNLNCDPKTSGGSEVSIAHTPVYVNP